MLHTIVLLLGRLNECFACFNPWIFVPPRSLDRDTYWLQALCLSLCYAILEPIATLVLQASTLPPWVLSLCLPPFGAGAAWVFVALQDCEIYEDLSSTAENKDKVEILKHDQRHQLRGAVTLLPSVLTTALINAVFLLFGQSLYASWIQQRYYITHFLGPLAVTINLVCRYADYDIYKRTGRPLALQELCCSSVYGPTIVCLGVLFSARLCVRAMVGVEPFLAFHRLGSVEADVMYPEPT